jgi:hypothetical protein
MLYFTDLTYSMISRQDCNKVLIYSSGDANADARLVLFGCMCHHTDNKIEKQQLFSE